jgi:hypothetical protein
VKTFALRALGRRPEELLPMDAAVLLEALKPMLRAFVGRERAEAVIERIRQEVEL